MIANKINVENIAIDVWNDNIDVENVNVNKIDEINENVDVNFSRFACFVRTCS